MSLTGEIHKRSGEIRESISKIAKNGIIGLDGMPVGTKKIIGYVCAINTDGEFAGTIDVQEFNYEPDEYATQGVGYHQGVFLSAIQDNVDGILIVPQLYSEVVIIQNPYDGHEYVIMYSHAKKIKWLAHSNESDDDGEIEIGVTEVEDFTETDDGLDKDFNELEPTKNKTSTKYTSKTISHQIISPDDEDGFQETTTVGMKKITVGKTSILINGENITIETSGNIKFKIGNTQIEESGTEIKITTTNAIIKGDNIEVNGKQVKITGGALITQGISSLEMNGPYNPIKTCPFSGAPHCGSIVTNT